VRWKNGQWSKNSWPSHRNSFVESERWRATDWSHATGLVQRDRREDSPDAPEDRLSQRLNWLEFVVHLVDASSLFPHRGEEAVIDDASRVRPLRIEWATRESGFGRLLFIVGDLSWSYNAVHTNNNRSPQCIVKDSSDGVLGEMPRN
jgi:hypothetical protein